MRILVTGGAGFIGRHVVAQFLKADHEVLIFDNLDRQAHPDQMWPECLQEHIEVGAELILQRGDIREERDFRLALDKSRPDVIIHLAAKVGVGQAEYEIQPYVETNTLGTAILLQEVKRYICKGHKPPHIMVAGSMSEYGEGMYRNLLGRYLKGGKRDLDALTNKNWNLPGTPIEIIETDPREPAGFYAITKAQQEDLVNAFHDCRTTVMRFFNVYGPEQTIGNPYTGVAAIFSNAILAGESPLIYEDGEQMRDFIYVEDLARAVCGLAETERDKVESQHEVFNICTGEPTSINKLFRTLAKALGHPDVEPIYPGKARLSDIRHCFGNCSKLKKTINWQPEETLFTGLSYLAMWTRSQEVIPGRQDLARKELSSRGLEV